MPLAPALWYALLAAQAIYIRVLLIQYAIQIVLMELSSPVQSVQRAQQVVPLAAALLHVLLAARATIFTGTLAIQDARVELTSLVRSVEPVLQVVALAQVLLYVLYAPQATIFTLALAI